MLGSTYDSQVCSVARALEVVGERWSLLIVRDLMLGLRRFEELQQDLGIARNVLASRLEGMIEHGIVERRPYSERPPRYEYRLTERGRDLWATVHALQTWGDRWEPAEGGPPTVLEHRGCGGAVDDRRTCTRCGAALSVDDVRALPGPGAVAGHPLLRRDAAAGA